MDFSRIASAIDIPRMQRSTVALIGAGASFGLACNLVRCGVQTLTAIDFDIVTAPNVPRQGHESVHLGQPKVEALVSKLLRLNRELHVVPLRRDVTTMSEAEIDDVFGDCDLIINATDSFQAAAKGNVIALQRGIPSLWIGLYPRGEGGEAVFWTPDLLACYRCLCPRRYAAHARAMQEGRSLDPASDGCTIFDIELLDSVAGSLAIGLLTAGADNRFGRLIAQLGDRNFIQIQLDPAWSLNGRNPVRDNLGIDPDCPAFFAWNAIARSDPDRGQLPCPDCEKYRGHQFIRDGETTCRVIPQRTEGGCHAA